MRHALLTVLAVLTLSLSLAGLATARDAPACTDTVQSNCDGWICVDTDHDGRLEPQECEPRYCTCDPQPQPW